MASQSPEGPQEPEGQFTVLAASVLTLLVGSGAMFLIVVALKPIAQEFDWPRAVPSLAFSLQFIGSGLGAMTLGLLLDRLGMGKPAFVAAIMIGTGAVLMSQISAAWQLYLIYGVMFGFFGAAALSAPAMANITRWYIRRRGMAVGLVAGGQSLAGILWPPIFGFSMQAYGWRATAMGYGVFALITILPLCLILRRPPPPFVPASSPSRKAGPGAGPVSEAPATQMPSRQLQIFLCAAIVCCCVAMGMPLGHLVSHITDLGHPVDNAVEVLSVLLMSAFISRAIFVGLLADNIGGLEALLIFSGIQAATLAAFSMFDGLYALYGIAIAFGFGYGGIFPVYAVSIREHMPFTEVGRRTGIVFMFGAFAMGFGNWIGGYLFDQTGSYTSAFLLTVAFNVANLAIVITLIFRIRRPALKPALG